MKRLILPFIFLFLITSRSYAEEAPITLKAEIDRAFITIGDEVQLKLSATHHPDVTILSWDADESLDDFDVKASKDFNFREKGKLVEGKRFTITSYELGQYVIKPITVQYRTKEGVSGKAITETLYITVETVDKNKDPDSDIKGVKGVLKIRSIWWIWALVLAFLTGVGVAAGWWWTNREKLQFNQKAAEPPLSPHDEAYQALNALSQSDLLRRGELKTYFQMMSEILRHYLERRYGHSMMEMTTRELLGQIKRDMTPDALAQVKQTLEYSDLVKFAKFVPEPMEILQQNKEAKKMIDMTKEEVTHAV